MLERFAKGPFRFTSLIATLRVPGAVLLLSACTSLVPADDRTMAEAYRQAIADPIRTDQDRRTDAARHPAEFLAFTQVRPGMQALDVSAGFGYTSQLLALAVGPTGGVWAQAQQPGAGLIKRLADHPQANLVVVARPFEDPVPEQAPKLDLVTLVLNYHDISYLPVDRARMNQRLFAALKPGGRYVIIDHSGRSGTGISEGKTLHRIDEAVVLAEVRQAGFVLDAKATSFVTRRTRATRHRPDRRFPPTSSRFASSSRGDRHGEAVYRGPRLQRAANSAPPEKFDVNHSTLFSTIGAQWDKDIVPQLTDYIRIPAKSPHFDAHWQGNGHIERVVALAHEWVRKQPVRGLTLEMVRLRDARRCFSSTLRGPATARHCCTATWTSSPR